MWWNTMATSDSTQEQPAYSRPESLRFPTVSAEYLHLVVSLGVFGASVAVIFGITTLGLITIAPIATSVGGIVGLLAVWLAWITLVVATPELAAWCVAAVRETQ